MGTPTTTIRLDEELKRQARPILEELGLNISVAVNMFLRSVVRCNGIPFDLSLGDPCGPARSTDIDFAAEYLAPLMSGRNESVKAGCSRERTRRRLERRREAINRGRRRVQ